MHNLRTILAAAAVSLLSCAVAEACPGCKAALASDSGGGDLVSGFFWSILFMMSMPFAIVTTFGASMYLAVRRARAEQAERESANNAPRAQL